MAPLHGLLGEYLDADTQEPVRPGHPSYSPPGAAPWPTGLRLILDLYIVVILGPVPMASALSTSLTTASAACGNPAA